MNFAVAAALCCTLCALSALLLCSGTALVCGQRICHIAAQYTSAFSAGWLTAFSSLFLFVSALRLSEAPICFSAFICGVLIRSSADTKKMTAGRYPGCAALMLSVTLLYASGRLNAGMCPAPMAAVFCVSALLNLCVGGIKPAALIILPLACGAVAFAVAYTGGVNTVLLSLLLSLCSGSVLCTAFSVLRDAECPSGFAAVCGCGFICGAAMSFII